MKRLATILSTLASILLILIVVFTALQVVINNNTFINNEFTKLGVAKEMGMNNADVVQSTVRLIDYMEGRVDSIDITVTVNGQKMPMFELEQEHSHMADVRTLYQTFRSGRDMGLLIMLALYLFALLVGFKRAARTLAGGYLSGAFVCMLFFGFIGTWAMLDFSSFWTFFHQMLFWNEEWLFDPTTSRMINMMPEQLFADIIGRTAVYAGMALGALLALSITSLAVLAGKRRKAEAQLEARRLAALERKRRIAAGEPVEEAPVITVPEPKAAKAAKTGQKAEKPGKKDKKRASGAPDKADAPSGTDKEARSIKKRLLANRGADQLDVERPPETAGPLGGPEDRT